MGITCTPSQAELLEKASKWFKAWESGQRCSDHSQWLSYSGAAGSGKTWIAQQIIKEIGVEDSYVAAAYVGKAVTRMQQCNMRAKTIHSLIYDAVPIVEKLPNGRRRITFEFVLKEALPDYIRLIVIDEGTMVNDELMEKILSFGKPVMIMGDKNQLPPVFGESSVMLRPDHTLREIMRQNENDPIVMLANMVLNDIPLMSGQYGRSSVIDHYDLTPRFLKDYDIAICNTNRLCGDINTYVRKNILRYPTSEPRIGDKVICRQNNWGITAHGFSLTNGLSGVITDIDRSYLHRGYYLMDFRPDFFPEDQEFTNLEVDSTFIKAPIDVQRTMNRTKHEKFQYAYAITTYSSQGSEWNRGIYFDSWFRDAILTKASRYTAITRFKEAVTIVTRQREIEKKLYKVA